jgi:hypothetical protein
VKKNIILSISVAMFFLRCNESKEHQTISMAICEFRDQTREIVDSTGQIVKIVQTRAAADLEGACWKSDNQDTMAIRFSIPMGSVVTVDILDENENIRQNIVNECDNSGYYEYYYIPTSNDVFGIRYASDSYNETLWYKY